MSALLEIETKLKIIRRITNLFSFYINSYLYFFKIKILSHTRLIRTIMHKIFFFSIKFKNSKTNNDFKNKTLHNTVNHKMFNWLMNEENWSNKHNRLSFPLKSELDINKSKEKIANIPTNVLKSKGLKL